MVWLVCRGGRGILKRAVGVVDKFCLRMSLCEVRVHCMVVARR